MSSSPSTPNPKMLLGMRVLRGPDWDQNEADGGEGHLGTVVGVKAEEGTAEVVWDNGQVTTCRVGKEGKHDLRIYDNATVGVQHHGVTCKACRRPNIYGTRWRCTACPNFDLCSQCYNLDVHEVTHQFERITREKDVGQGVGSRQGGTRMRVAGIFPGAKVVRGPHWSSGDRDGGPGTRGVVVEVVSPESGSARNAVRVSWDSSGQSVQHRLGLHGKVDLVCTEEAPGPACYLHHLPVLDHHTPTRPDSATTAASAAAAAARSKEAAARSKEADARATAAEARAAAAKAGATTTAARATAEGAGATAIGATGATATGAGATAIGATGAGATATGAGATATGAGATAATPVPHVTGGDITVGSYVRVRVDEETLKVLQKQRGGWTVGMAKCLEKTGRVKEVALSGELDVVFEGQKWRVNPAALEQVEGVKMEVGDTVRILADEAQVKSLMRGRANWSDNMKKALGKVGRLVDIDTDGDFRVVFGERGWFFNPEVCLPAPGCPEDFIEREESGRETTHRLRDDIMRQMREVWLRRDKDLGDSSNALTVLFKVIESGRTDIVQQMLEARPELARESMEHGTALHYAAYRGQLESMRLLVAWGADLNRGDYQQRTPMMRAIDGRKLEAVAEMLELGADINQADEDGATALHRAFQKERNDISRFLLQRNPDLNKRDKEGQTPLFDAVKKRNTEPGVLDTLLDKPGLDLHVVDRKGFKAIHSATLKNRTVAVQKLISRDPALVNAKERDESYMPIHIAANNDHTELLHLLLRNGSEISPRTRIGETPLHMSSTKVFVDSTMVLVEKGADINAQDNDGDTPLHNCLGREEGSLRELLGGGDSHRPEASLQVANYLIQMGARTDIRNHSNQTPLDVASGELREKVECFMEQSGMVRPVNTADTSTTPPCNNTTEAESKPSTPTARPVNTVNSQTASPLNTANPVNTASTEPARPMNTASPVNTGRPMNTASTVNTGRSMNAGSPVNTASSGSAPRNGPCCLTCSSRAADVILLPCAHKVSCRECGPSLQTCPKCRKPVRNRVDTGGRRLEQTPTSSQVSSSAEPGSSSSSRQPGKEVTREECKVQ